MIKEVEVFNTTEILDADENLVLDVRTYPDIISAELSNNGATMTVKVNRERREDCYRRVSLMYIVPDYAKQTVTEYAIGDTAMDTYDYEQEYVFDLSPVLTTIIQPTPEQIANDTVTIRTYTYEANISIDYGTVYPVYDPSTQYYIDDLVKFNGRLFLCKNNCMGILPSNSNYWQSNIVPSSGTKTLHVPYSVSYPGIIVSPQSTDGWYCVRVLDVSTDYNRVCYPNDILSNGGGDLFICIVETLGQDTTSDFYWRPLTAEEETNLYMFGYEESGTGSIATLLNTDMLVTRYVKQKYIYELLTKSNYKRHDNLAVVMQLEKIYAMREAAIIHLCSGNPIFARQLLDMIAIEVNSYTKNNGQKTVVEAVNAGYTI